MAKKGKRYKDSLASIDLGKSYSLDEAVSLLTDLPKAKFDQSVEVSIKLGVDPKKSDQMVRGSCKLPFGTGKERKVLVFCEAEKEQEAKDSGADFVGGQALIDKISKGWVEFDCCISTPSMMKNVSRLGKTLGPRGLMPSFKTGSVTDNLSLAVKDAKGGKLDFKMNKAGALNAGVGKASFSKDQITANITAFIKGLIQSKPQSVKGKFIQSITLSLTMSPGLKVNLSKELQV